MRADNEMATIQTFHLFDANLTSAVTAAGVIIIITKFSECDFRQL